MVSASLVGTQTAQSVELLRLSVEHEMLLAGIQTDVASSSNHLSTALLPLLAGSRRQAQDCIDAQVRSLGGTLEDFRRVYSSLQLFASQNVALSDELKTTSSNKNLALQKLSLARLEIDMGKKLAGMSGSSAADISSRSSSSSNAAGGLGEQSVAHAASTLTTTHGVVDDKLNNGNKQGAVNSAAAATSNRSGDEPISTADTSFAAALHEQPHIHERQQQPQQQQQQQPQPQPQPQQQQRRWRRQRGRLVSTPRPRTRGGCSPDRSSMPTGRPRQAPVPSHTRGPAGRGRGWGRRGQ